MPRHATGLDYVNPETWINRPEFRKNAKEGDMRNLHLDRWQILGLILLFTAYIADHFTTKHQGIRLAYVDPGAGLLAFQILGASVMGGYYLLRRKLQSLFSRLKPNRSAADTQSQTY